MSPEQKQKFNEFLCKVRGHDFKVASSQKEYTPNIVFVCRRCGRVDTVKR